MSRWIDADALKANIDKSIFDADDKEWYLTLLANAPTIETKQVKYFDEDENVWKIGNIIRQ